MRIFSQVTGGQYLTVCPWSLVSNSEQILLGHRWTLVNSLPSDNSVHIPPGTSGQYFTFSSRSLVGYSEHILPGHR